MSAANYLNIYLFYKGTNADNGAFKRLVNRYKLRYLYVPGPPALPDCLKDMQAGLSYPYLFAIAIGRDLSDEDLVSESDGEYNADILTMVGDGIINNFMTWFNEHNQVKTYTNRIGMTRKYTKIVPVKRPAVPKTRQELEQQLRHEEELQELEQQALLKQQQRKQIHNHFYDRLHTELIHRMLDIKRVLHAEIYCYQMGTQRYRWYQDISTDPLVQRYKGISEKYEQQILQALADYCDMRTARIRETAEAIYHEEEARHLGHSQDIDILTSCIYVDLQKDDKESDFALTGSPEQLFYEHFDYRKFRGSVIQLPSSKNPRVVKPRYK